MGFAARAVLTIAGILVAVFVARDTPNFGVIQGAVALLLVVAVVSLLAFLHRRR